MLTRRGLHLTSLLFSPTRLLLPLHPASFLLCRYKSNLNSNLFLENKNMATRPVVVQHSHCNYCGTKYAEGLSFPRECAHCSRKVYVNPVPVAVCVMPVDDGVLVVRRSIPPCKGQLAFPGGFINVKENWQQAVARELYEETGIIIDPVEIEHLDTASAPDADVILVFGVCSPRKSKDLEPFVPNHEVSERLVINKFEELAFSLHTDVLKQFFSKKRKSGERFTMSK